MLHLRRAGLLDTGALTVTGEKLGALLDWWEQSERRTALRGILKQRDGVDPDDVIMDPDGARLRGLTSTVTFPVGNLAPGGSVIKSTAIDPIVVDDQGIYRKRGPARVFLTEKAAVAAIKSHGPDRIHAGDVLVLMCRGPMGSGMEEIFEITSALRYLEFGKHVAVLTDARFSGVLDWRVHRPYHSGGTGRRSARQDPRRRCDRNCRRSRRPHRIHSPGGRGRSHLRSRGGRPHPGGPTGAA